MSRDAYAAMDAWTGRTRCRWRVRLLNPESVNAAVVLLEQSVGQVAMAAVALARGGQPS
jgi:hypothetical protein